MDKILGVNFSCHQAASESRITKPARLLTDKANNFHGGLQGKVLLLEGSHRLQRCNDTQGTVELSPVENRVQMRADEECGCFRVSAVESAKNISDSVDVDTQTDLPHLVNEKLAASELFD